MDEGNESRGSSGGKAEHLFRVIRQKFGNAKLHYCRIPKKCLAKDAVRTGQSVDST